MTIVDTHSHLYDEHFVADLDAVIKRAQDIGVQKFYMPSIDSSTLDAMLAVEKKYARTCFAMAGVHPCSIKENYETELAIVAQQLQSRPYVAVGEIGLDFYWDTTFETQQIDAFQKQMQWALTHKRPIVIHSRNATNKTLELVKPFAEKGLRGIFHCFGGSIEEAKKIINLNFYLGIGGVLTYPKSGLAAVMGKINLEHIVLETDAPYLPPVPHRGKRNESSYLQHVIQHLATIKNIDVATIAAATTLNAEKLFAW